MREEETVRAEDGGCVGREEENKKRKMGREGESR